MRSVSLSAFNFFKRNIFHLTRSNPTAVLSFSARKANVSNMAAINLSLDKSNPHPVSLMTAEHLKSNNKPIDVTYGDKNMLKVTNDIILTLDHTISRYLGRLHQQTGLYGSNNIQSSEVDHWMDFSVLHFENAQNLNVDSIKYLDQSLSSVSFLVGNQMTLADFAVWIALHRNPKWIGLQKNTKASTHVLRWFNFCAAQDVFKRTASVLPSASPRKAAEKGEEKGKSLKTTMEEGGKFIRLPNAKDGEVVVRFPPEASGYLHIGHAKAALMNQYYRDLHNGKLIMRFDDTNPAKENAHFEEIILEDIKLLHLTPDIYSRTSDHFEIIMKYGEQLINESKAYCDDTPPEEMQQVREKKLESKNRKNSLEKNLSMWNEMKLGTDIGRGICLRAIIDHQSDNGCLRDPVLYRCRAESHLVTGDKYKVYPTYDFACPIVDSIEGVTHALRTTEYHDRDPQYFWMLKALGLREPYIYDYSRLALVNTVLSKRKLTFLVNEGVVDGWDDPRLPTVRGILRRGLTIEGLKEFIVAQGSSKANVHMEWDKIWSFNKKVIDPICPRYTALLKSKVIPVYVEGASQSSAEYQCNPKNPDGGMKTVWYGDKIFIEGEDVSVLKENDLVTFINWGNLRIKSITRDDNGSVNHVNAALELDNKDFKKTVKLTWLAENNDAVFTPTVCLHFDHIITKAVLTKNDDFKQLINRDNKSEYEMMGDPCLRTVAKGQTIQLQRRGYFICDQAYAPPSRHSGRCQPCVLINIPDGHTKNMPSSGAVSSSTVPKENLVSANKEVKVERSNTKDAGHLSSEITVQGDKIRQLKSEKADKATIKAEVDRLLTLKAEYKTVTGADFKPAATPQVTGKSSPVKKEINSNTKSADNLSAEITAQGDKIRQLKSEKADKGKIKAEVDCLLALKAEYKTITGADFKPAAAQQVTKNSASAEKEVNTSNTKDAGNLSAEITAQGDKVRQLKSQKADKATIKPQVDLLLSLKALYKAVTGEDYKPAPQQQQKPETTMVVQNGSNATDELKAKITEQGNAVRSLKTASAPKDEVDEAVKLLLSLKAQYKSATGEDFPAPSSAGGKRDKKSKTKQQAQAKQEVKPAAAVPTPGSQDASGGKKVTRLGLEAKKEEMLSDWYSQVITKSEMIEYYDVSGCYILRPWAFGIWEQIQSFFDKKIKASGVENSYFPMFVSQQALEKEKEHISDFAPEVAWVTKSGQSELAEPIAIRPTSETVMYPAYAKWIKSHRDLPLRLNQWCNVVRWEFKHPQPFLRTREFLWQEGHTAFATRDEACKEVYEMLDYYAAIYNELLAIPVVKGQKTEKEKFAGGDFTTTCEAYIEASGRAIQGATSHHLGQNFSKMFDIVFEDPNNPDAKEKLYVHQNSWGITTRTIGVMVMVHGDNKGLVLPPRVAKVQVIVVPCGVNATMDDKEGLLSKCEEYSAMFNKEGIRSKTDLRDNYSPGWKFNHWELKGVPIRIELGPRDLKSNQIVAVRRDTGEKVTLPYKDCATKISTLLETIQSDMYNRAKKQLDENLVVCSKWEEFVSALDNKKLIQAPFCGGIQCEERIKKDSAREDQTEIGAPSMGAKSLCIPFEQPKTLDDNATCIHPKCNEKAKDYTMFGRSY